MDDYGSASDGSVLDPPSFLSLISKQVPARVALGVTTLLAMSTQQASINRSLPPVAYTKAVDVFTGNFVNFGFLALLGTVNIKMLLRFWLTKSPYIFIRSYSLYFLEKG